MNYPENINIEKIYWVKRKYKKIWKRVRAKINGKTYFVGDQIKNTFFTLKMIQFPSYVEIWCDITGQKYLYTNIRMEK